MVIYLYRTLGREGIMRTQQQSKILDAAERLFLKKGITLTSINDICNEVEISKGTLYYHYSSKNAIVDDLAARYIDKTEDALQKFIMAVMDKDLETVLHQCLNVVRLKKTTEKLHYIFVTYGIVAYPKLKELMKIRYEKWVNDIKTALDSYRPNADDNYILSHVILAIFDGFALRNMLDLPSVFDDREVTLKFIKSLNINEK